MLHGLVERWICYVERVIISYHTLLSLSLSILQEDFDAYFSTFAPCTSNVIQDRETGKNKGFGFVAFHDDGAGLSALDAGQLPSGPL